MTGSRGPSLAAQVLALTLAAIVVAQAMTLIAIRFAPVLPPPRHSLGQVVAAFKGRRLADADRRPLTRQIEAVLPRTFQTGDEPAMARQLATALGAAPRDVRVVRHGPSPMIVATSGGSMPDGRIGFYPPRHDAPFGQAGGNYDEFAAALHLPDGRWLIVRPTSEWEWLRRIAIWVIGSLAVMAMPAWWLARRITHPLRRFADAADELGRNPRAPQVPLDGPAEIGAAARAFNQMRTRVQTYVSDRVAMVGAISHDIGSPLARLCFRIERLDPEARALLMPDAERMRVMLTGVLSFLKDIDTGSPRLRLDLTSLVACAVDDRLAAGDAVSMDEDTPSVVVDGDAVALRTVVDNVLDNAVHFGAHVRVALIAAGDQATITIADDGPGLPESELEAVFQPFYRHAPDGLPRMGPGLTAARTVARTHGGDVVLKRGGRGVIAEITLPVAPPLRVPSSATG